MRDARTWRIRPIVISARISLRLIWRSRPSPIDPDRWRKTDAFVACRSPPASREARLGIVYTDGYLEVWMDGREPDEQKRMEGRAGWQKDI
jgi:hypothetical protein